MTESIGRFHIRKRLGGGGFGEVFLAEDPGIGRKVAIKLFRPRDENLVAFATSSDEEGLQILRTRFLNEAKILAALENTVHVVNVLEYGELPDGAPYYVMPYLPHALACPTLLRATRKRSSICPASAGRPSRSSLSAASNRSFIGLPRAGTATFGSA
jgi:serine/threonine protein kinase